jgi:hypothetical protein
MAGEALRRPDKVKKLLVLSAQSCMLFGFFAAMLKYFVFNQFSE